jgi:hypothetical protein
MAVFAFHGPDSPQYVSGGLEVEHGFRIVPYATLTPDDSDGAGVNIIPVGVNFVIAGANVNDVNDYLVLPDLDTVPVGYTVQIMANAAGHEVRTPATSAQEINSEDCDGTKEFAMAADSMYFFTKLGGSIGWLGWGTTALGATTAVVPD